MSLEHRSKARPPRAGRDPDGRIGSNRSSTGPVRLPLTEAQRARARGLLDAESSSRVLAALDRGDPLGLAERVHHCLRRGAWLVDPRELRRLALARVALNAASWRGRPALEVWLDAQIDAALAELLESGPRARFHRLPREVRDLFCRAVLDGEDPESLARQHCGDLSRLGRMLLLGLEALLEDSGSDLRETLAGPVTPSEAARPSGVECS